MPQNRIARVREEEQKIMKLDELITTLQAEREIHGNIEVTVQGLWIDKDGEVSKGSPLSVPPYALMADNGDVLMAFERVVYE